VELGEKLRSLRLPFVPGKGPLAAKLLLLGEALGAEEVVKGEPFVGKAGWMLDDILKRAGVKRSECYVMNVIPTRPPENDVSRLPELGVSLEECRSWCLAWIGRFLRPNAIMALGRTAMEALTGKTDVTDWRGSILEGEVGGKIVKVIPSFHPSYVMRMAEKTAKEDRAQSGGVKYTYGSARLTLILDAKRAKEESVSSSLERPSRMLVVEPSLDEVKAYLVKARALPRVSFDVETKGKWVDCIGFSGDPGHAICIPRGEDYWGHLAGEVDRCLQDFLWEHEGLVTQNGSFDLTMLLGNGIPVRMVKLDTLVGHHFLYPELPHDLHYLTSIYTREPYYKWMLRASKDPRQRWHYNCLDCAVTREVAGLLEVELAEAKVEKEFFQYVMPLMHVVLKMGFRGVSVDLEWKKRLQRVLEYLIKRKVKYMQKELGFELNHRSPTQVREYVYGTLGLPKQYKRGTTTVTTDEAAIEKLSQMPGGEKLRCLLEVRDVEKKKSTYADLKLPSDGVLRTRYSVSGTETGRLSSKQDLFGFGWNSQNPPKWFRRVVIPGAGRVLLEADLKFAEALLIAWFSKDQPTIQAVKSGVDIYKWHAGRSLGKEPGEVSKEERKLFKPVVLGCGYGLGPNHMWEMLSFEERVTPDGRTIKTPTGISRARAKDLRDLFFRSCPAIGEYQEQVREKITKTRELVTPFNRRRIFLGRLGEELFRKGFAFLPQSSCVEYVNRALVRVEMQTEEEFLALQIHDAMFGVAKLEREAEVREVVLRELAVPVVVEGEPLVIPTELKRSEKNWRDMEEVGVFNNFV
jgi:uracil-DNA glycosylase